VNQPTSPRERINQFGLIGILLVAWAGDRRVTACPPLWQICFGWYLSVRAFRSYPHVERRLRVLFDEFGYDY
jgi:hypothetical protein